MARKLRDAQPASTESGAVRVLAALMHAPLGLHSARRVAVAAGTSPTTASRRLRELVAVGVVEQTRQRVVRGTARDEDVYRLDPTAPSWKELAPRVRRVRLPQRSEEPANRVPRRFYHLFWNSDPTALTVQGNGAYIARRMLTSNDPAAIQWSLRNIPAADLEFASTGRGIDPRLTSVVKNWNATR
ncbi:winged helix-turn-helix domain-containing protein [Homoserinibacter sp. GY 40078]|uniref:winged helix-turn-helix domain-containing protein n=1 Tax=Homoserinibacter sp. GY 40078 TaxID=2603275 RepID=UPI0011C7CD3A|nr:winged helix-turn-helix domain-containing protein [Homoserinibacter sp. GY 40078]TXK18840.1 winged helix-turn-helix transcriptional regulator [Homoserinibacter sp. GY 40078]